MININGKEYKSYAEAIVDLIADMKKIEEEIPDVKDFITEEKLKETLEGYAKTSDLSNYVLETTLENSLANYLRKDDTGYTNLLEDNKVHNSNWVSIIGDLETLS